MAKKGKKKKTVIAIAVSEEEKKLLSDFSKNKLRLPLSSWMKYLALREMNIFDKEEKK